MPERGGIEFREVQTKRLLLAHALEELTRLLVLTTLEMSPPHESQHPTRIHMIAGEALQGLYGFLAVILGELDESASELSHELHEPIYGLLLNDQGL